MFKVCKLAVLLPIFMLLYNPLIYTNIKIPGIPSASKIHTVLPFV
jgi:hypothetical protein